MCPTSIAVWRWRLPPHTAQASPSRISRRSAKRGSKSRPAWTPRRWTSLRFAPTTYWPSRRVSSATTATETPTGPMEPPESPKACWISSCSAGRNVLAERLEQLHLVEPVVAAHEREDDAAVGHDRHRLRRRAGIHAEKLRDVLDRALLRRLDLLWPGQLLGEVGRATAGPARSRDRPRSRRSRRSRACSRPSLGREEVLAPAAAHDPGLRLRPRRSRARSARRSGCSARMLPEALVEPGLVAVERVAVLHDELAKAEQRSARPGLVAVFRLKVVPELRQLLVRLDLARVEGRRSPRA